MRAAPSTFWGPGSCCEIAPHMSLMAVLGIGSLHLKRFREGLPEPIAASKERPNHELLNNGCSREAYGGSGYQSGSLR